MPRLFALAAAAFAAVLSLAAPVHCTVDANGPLEVVSRHYDEAAKGFNGLTDYFTSLEPLGQKLAGIRHNYDEAGQLRAAYEQNPTFDNYVNYQNALSGFYLELHGWYRDFLGHRAGFEDAWTNQTSALNGLKGAFQQVQTDYQSGNAATENEIRELDRQIAEYASLPRHSLTDDDRRAIRRLDLIRRRKQEYINLINRDLGMSANAAQTVDAVQGRLGNWREEMRLAFEDVAQALPALGQKARHQMLRSELMKLRIMMEQHSGFFSQIASRLKELTIFDPGPDSDPLTELVLPGEESQYPSRGADEILDEALAAQRQPSAAVPTPATDLR